MQSGGVISGRRSYFRGWGCAPIPPRAEHWLIGAHCLQGRGVSGTGNVLCCSSVAAVLCVQWMNPLAGWRHHCSVYHPRVWTNPFEGEVTHINATTCTPRPHLLPDTGSPGCVLRCTLGPGPLSQGPGPVLLAWCFLSSAPVPTRACTYN